MAQGMDGRSGLGGYIHVERLTNRNSICGYENQHESCAYTCAYASFVMLSVSCFGMCASDARVIEIYLPSDLVSFSFLVHPWWNNPRDISFVVYGYENF
jgi:hypothetical protein